MKFTSEDLMKAMGLKVGDRVKRFILDDEKAKKYEIIYEVIKSDVGRILLVNLETNNITTLHTLVDQEYEILPQPKRVGDLKCSNDCYRNNEKCPIRNICRYCCDLETTKTLYEFLEDYRQKYANDLEFDQEIYDLLKARLDKEVEEK